MCTACNGTSAPSTLRPASTLLNGSVIFLMSLIETTRSNKNNNYKHVPRREVILLSPPLRGSFIGGSTVHVHVCV